MPQFVTNLTNKVFALWNQFYWLPEWAVISIITAVFVFIGWAANQVVFALLKLAVRNRDVFWKGMLGRARLKVRIAVMIIALALAVTVSPLDPEPSLFIRRTLLFAFILVCGWILAGAVDMGAVVHLKKFNMDTEDNLYARKHITQTRILQRVAAILIGLITLGLALMTIPGVRQWGLSLLASAGVVGIVAGLALQPFLTNLIAGIQIATAQPIRLDDAVIVEGEWGRVEEITSTYVVVKLWDWRRMILPLTYFIQKPFQNWTRDDSRLIGVAFLYVDYEAPIDRLRVKLESIAHASPLWDGDVVSLQVTDITARVAQVRCLTSARNASLAFDLRCEVREKMLAFMRDECPQALPRDRVDLDRNGQRILPPLHGEGG
ncbi:small-conductance mechanosensitive channel [Brevundimonas bullata]|uniref:Small-conductance mechanosensitive channel n=1 Tax=Brevundimonas bullata TaxID=13160 RepID=A0A7W7IRD2_9CAUL|nr:mechanosensitive ion channel family protein [Brevundimonas bullata]MBB4798630.1 small-conductance mechanosensitive channel [Brevundimonas bullata]MBB6383055.1 small-conductance mechanosensitive channel [Brevundimonas bullata]